MLPAWDRLQRRLSEGGQLTARQQAKKASRLAWELASARLWLSDVQHVGRRVRTRGRPRVENLGTMRIDDDVQIRSIITPVELATGPGGTLSIGEGSFLNYGSSLGAWSEVHVGRWALIGTYATIIDTHFHDPLDRSRPGRARPVVLEDDVWIGAKAMVLRGVRVGRGAIVSAGSVVSEDVEPFAIVQGVPARQVGKIDERRFVSGAEKFHGEQGEGAAPRAWARSDEDDGLPGGGPRPG